MNNLIDNSQRPILMQLAAKLKSSLEPWHLVRLGMLGPLCLLAYGCGSLVFRLSVQLFLFAVLGSACLSPHLFVSLLPGPNVGAESITLKVWRRLGRCVISALCFAPMASPHTAHLMHYKGMSLLVSLKANRLLMVNHYMYSMDK